MILRTCPQKSLTKISRLSYDWSCSTQRNKIISKNSRKTWQYHRRTSDFNLICQILNTLSQDHRPKLKNPNFQTEAPAPLSYQHSPKQHRLSTKNNRYPPKIKNGRFDHFFKFFTISPPLKKSGEEYLSTLLSWPHSLFGLFYFFCFRLDLVFKALFYLFLWGVLVSLEVYQDIWLWKIIGDPIDSIDCHSRS